MMDSIPPNAGDPPNAGKSAPAFSSRPESSSLPDSSASPDSNASVTATVGDSPITAASAPSALPERNFFQSSSLLSVFARLCIYLILSYSLIYAIPRLFIPLLRPTSFFAPKILMAGELSFAAGAYLPAWFLSLMERRSFRSYGLPAQGAFSKLFWQGVLLGLAEISGVIGTIAAFGSYRFGSIAIHGIVLARYAVFWAVFFLVVGLVEEFQYRGYVQFTLSQAVGFWPAAVLLSVGFGVVHLANQGENWVGGAGVALTGLLWCFTLRRTGNLWLAVGMHASFDFGETFLYSVPDSGYLFPGHLSNATLAGPAWLTGGSVGPEASVFDFVTLILFFFVIHWLYPARSSKSTTQALPAA
jgi:uncharacterized protein